MFKGECKMNEILSFFQDMVTSNLTNQKPVGLSGFRHPQKPKPMPKRHHKKEEMKISDLLRRH